MSARIDSSPFDLKEPAADTSSACAFSAANAQPPGKWNEFRPSAAGRPPPSQARVLVADDLKLSQTLLITLLRQQRVSDIETADDGSSALQCCMARRFDAVFVDIDMPGMDGFDVLAAIKALDPTVFVCLVSGSSNIANLIKARALGVDAFLAKPVSGSRLAGILALYAKDGGTGAG